MNQNPLSYTMRDGSWIGKLGSSTAPNAVASKQAVPARMVRFSFGINLRIHESLYSGDGQTSIGALDSLTHFPNSRSLSPLLSIPFRPIRRGRFPLRATMKLVGQTIAFCHRSPLDLPKNEKYQTNPFLAVTQTNKIAYAHPPRTRVEPVRRALLHHFPSHRRARADENNMVSLSPRPV